MNIPSSDPATPAGADAGEILLSVRHVSKHYRLWQSPSARLRYSLLSQAHKTISALLPPDSAALSALRRGRDALQEDFTALRDISFQLRRGESMGIIGRNGSGKSTLLQLIAGTLRPTGGCVEVRGRVAALLELGSGFNPEFTGRENVYLNGSILGFSRQEIDARFDAIAGFADIGQFLDQPVKTYSSGMMVRLAFAVQVAVEPDLFIVDEALAVGDIYFQSKCNKLLRQKLLAGMTLLFVSHDPTAVRSLCSRALVLDRGDAVFLGPSDEATNVYHAVSSGALAGKNLAATRAEAAPTGPPTAGQEEPAAAEAPPADEIGPDGAANPELTLQRAAAAIPPGLGRFQDEIGDGSLALTGCALFDVAGRRAYGFAAGDPIRAAVWFVPARDFAAGELIAGFQVRDRFNNVVTAGTSVNAGMTLPAARAGVRQVLLLRLGGRLGPGKYLLDFGLGSEPDHADSARHYHHRIGGIAAFAVEWFERKITFQGICDVGAQFVCARGGAPL